MSSTTTTTTTTTTHRALILPQKGSPLTLTTRQTPTPGPNEILIRPHSLALNPIDFYSRDFGFAISSYPAIIGSDICGTIISTGSSTPSQKFKNGDRVVGFAPAFYTQGKPEYGAFQEKVLVPDNLVAKIPDGLGWDEGATLPMAVLTAWSGLYSIGLPKDVKGEGRGFLVWGAASSVGMAVVQIVKSLGFIVFVAASKKHHEVLRELGAGFCFDYGDRDVVEQMVEKVRKEGVGIEMGYLAVGSWKAAMEVLHRAKGKDVEKVYLASAPPVKEEELLGVDDVEVKFVGAPKEEKEREEHFDWVFNVWLEKILREGKWIPAPKVRVIEGGLEGINKGLDELKKGASGEKLVVRV